MYIQTNGMLTENTLHQRIFQNVTLIQSKKHTHLIESSNNQQRHWLTEFTRKTICTTQSLKHLNILLFLFYYCRTNGNGITLGMNL